jgi:outer membrane protein
MINKTVLIAASLLVAAAFAAPAANAQSVSGVSAVEMFDLADQARAANRLADAEGIYVSLARDPELEIRTEARFRLGQMLEEQGRFNEAAVMYRALLDEQPNAPRVRIELARLLARLGEVNAAGRQLRQAQAAGLPPDISQVIDRFATALRSLKPYGLSFELAMAPDSNINRATDAETLDTIIAPIDLSDDARAQSGIGVKLGGQAFARLPVGQKIALLPRLSASGDLYGDSQFNDLSARIQIGIERIETLSGRATLSFGQSWRWFGGDPYLRTTDVTLDWLRPSGKRAQIGLGGIFGVSHFPVNPLQDGMQFGLNAGYERALTPVSGGGAKIDILRQTARDRGYANVSAGVTGLYFHDIGRISVFSSTTLRRLVSDKPFFLFPDKRREWLVRASIGASFRRATVKGFAPLLRLTYERNYSTVAIYDYQRRALEVGVSRAF